MENISSFNDFIIKYKKFNIGDIVSLMIDVEEDPDDGLHSYSIDKGEHGKIRSIVNPNDIPSEIIYRINFPDKEGKKRSIQLLGGAIEKVK